VTGAGSTEPQRRRFGLILPQGWRGDLPGRNFETVAGVARAADELGFDSIWMYDHLQTRDGDPEPVLECWTALAALARETKRVRLGQIVTCALYRNPGLLAQMASTLDAASGDRVFLGIGAGWDEREYVDFEYGEALPPVRERLTHLERTLRVLRARRPERPILVGGAGEKVLLRLVAQYADACNFTDSFDPDFYRHKLEVLRSHCHTVGRDYDEILKTASFTVREGDEVDFEALAAAGIEYFILYLDPPTDLNVLERFASQADVSKL
jgi:alkanesulfonate monooxygenase SsuD/methylene tetrahydromethanopterin reductase-like flavin-dependent oxidoreductase (luciferase family)